MSKQIIISIPSSSGEQLFHVSRKALLFTIIGSISVLGLSTIIAYYSWYQHSTSRSQVAQLLKQLHQTEQQYQQQVDETHTLSQELEEKRDQLHTLGKRVYDVESVLGLADDTQAEEHNLLSRLDAAAIDSAVRATMFRMIPNDAPMDYLRISSSYGKRTNPITGKRHTHTGIDLTCKRGEPIYAPADGVVETVRPSTKGFGNFLTLRHSFGFVSSYAHLAKFKVRSGQFVSKGDLIAACGNSGNSTGPHLHYEVRFLGRALNPQYMMDWTPENFNYLFEKEKKVKWAPLVKLINNTVRLQVNLTHQPYEDQSVHTVKNR
ncbi:MULTISPECIES: M23 family metallopeptidase [Vibrio]|uniref:M23 family metallopeptidase n=1 Tax=Vibrio TaxID=662 RepID=UPI002075989A|nr:MULTISPECIES: M23 family metallopeptidase [Vibrio]USD33025.1 M23 family metallopeptidase [Vibrio sp. SCSIO 43186]USD46093.1 M23 family metallopeptidase [Vibrio sp. SCSIO 43145]USD70149.1 M23 family metallopeptidase [Vibrio sp. SCSIO 43139]USD95064.1 peptidase M23 [Vibrio coralliilyticus]